MAVDTGPRGHKKGTLMNGQVELAPTDANLNSKLPSGPNSSMGIQPQNEPLIPIHVT